MATADDYAKWLVGNKDKKGTPEFDTVAQAYEMAKAEESGAGSAVPEPELASVSQMEPTAAPMDTAPMAEGGPEMYPGQVYNPMSDIPQLDAQGNLIQPEQAPVQERTLGQMNEGVREAALTTATGATGGTAGMIYGTLNQLAKEIGEGKYGTREAANRVADSAAKFAEMLTYQPKTEAGKEYVQQIGEVGAQLAPLAGLTGEMQMIAQSGRQAALNAGPTVRQAVGSVAAPETTLPIAETAQNVGQRIVRGVEGAREGYGSRRKNIVETIRNEPYNVENVEYRIENDRPVTDNLATETLRQGWEPAEVTTIKAMSPKDKIAALRMIATYEDSKKDARAGALSRPAAVLGESVTDRIAFVNDARKKAGSDLETIAKNDLRGERVDYAPAIDKFMANLDDLGISVEMDAKTGIAKANLRNSEIQGDRKAQQILNNVLERLSDVDAPDAFGLHTAKRFIDTQVSWGKQSLGNPLTDQAARALKELRTDLNTILGDNFPQYREANQIYSSTKSALDDLQKAAKVKVDLDSKSANEAYGTAMRRVLSNYASRAQIIEALDQLESVAIQNGLKINDDLINQLIFVNAIDRMFGAPGAMTFKGQIEQAMRPGLEAAQRRDVAGIAMDLAAKAYERAQGINEANALQSMKDLLKRKEPKKAK